MELWPEFVSPPPPKGTTMEASLLLLTTQTKITKNHYSTKKAYIQKYTCIQFCEIQINAQYFMHSCDPLAVLPYAELCKHISTSNEKEKSHFPHTARKKYFKCTRFGVLNPVFKFPRWCDFRENGHFLSPNPCNTHVWCGLAGLKQRDIIM